MELYTFKNVSFSYPNVETMTLENINLSIHSGDFIILFGESGSGKTTLLRMLKPEITPHGKQIGQIYYKDKNLHDIPDQLSASKIGFVMQNPDLQIVADTVWYELAFGLENLALPLQEMQRRIAETANYFGIHHWYDRKIETLSGGQKQLLNLASIVIMEPEVLILDEPTAQLDPIAKLQFIQLLKQINDDFGITIIIAEHDLQDVFSIANRILFIENGNIVYDSVPKQIGSELRNEFNEEKLFTALPDPVKLFYELNGRGTPAVTVREAKIILNNYDEKYPQKKLEHTVTKENIPQCEKPIIALKNIWFRYERNAPDVLSSVNLEINQREILTILGGNGSGKSTLLKAILGLLHIQRGSIKVNGKRLKQYNRDELYKNLLGYLPQDPLTLFTGMTIYEDYLEMNRAMNVTNEEFTASIEKVSKEMEIDHLLKHHPYDLSGGEQQKVALGKILLLNPKILLLDEPTKGMDIYYKRHFAKLLKKLKQKGTTIVMVTHDIEFSAKIADRCGLFFDKKISNLESPEQFFAKNKFYTTVASRMARHILPHAITYDQIIESCKIAKESD